jgi:hypothetical protein
MQRAARLNFATLNTLNPLGTGAGREIPRYCDSGGRKAAMARLDKW